MGKILDAMDQQNLGGTIKGTALLDLTKGGVNGNIPVIGKIGTDGKNFEAWVSNHAYVSQDVIAVVLKTPMFFDFLPNPEKWKMTWKSLFEVHAMSITGLNSGLTVETEEEELGGTGEFQESIKDTKKARTTITLEVKEKMNKSVQKYIDYVIRYGQKDYITKKPLVSDFIDDINAIAGGYTPDYYTGTVLFIEPDITRKGVVDAWFSTQIFFKGNGDRTGKRQLAGGGEGLTLSLSLASITLSTDKVFDLAEQLLPTLTSIQTIGSDMELSETAVPAEIAEDPNY